MDSLVDFYLNNLGQKLCEKGINLDISQMRGEYDKVFFFNGKDKLSLH